MKLKSSKKIISKELTNRELADLLVKKISSVDEKISGLNNKFEGFDKKVNSVAVTMDKKFSEVIAKIDHDINELAGMVARGFEDCVTQKDLFYVQSKTSEMFSELNRRIDQMKFNHDQRIKNAEDKLMIHKNIFESKLKIKVPLK